MTISVEALFEHIQNNSSVTWIDVRTHQEFSQERPDIAALENLPLDQIDTLDLPKDKQFFVSCLSGKRSQAAKDILMSYGYTQVLNVTGGYLAWQNANLPITKQ